MGGDHDRAGERAAREAGDQPAQAGLAEAVDVLGDIGQQRADQRIGREVHQEGQQHHRAHVGRRPDIGEAFAQGAQRCGMGRLLAQHAQAPHPDVEGQRQARRIEEADAEVGQARSQQRHQARPRQGAHHPRRIGGRARHAHGPHQVVRRHGLADQEVAQGDVGGPDQPHDRGQHEHRPRRGLAAQEQRRQRRRHGEVGGAHHAEHLAIADAVARHAEQGRDQGAEELQGAENGQRQDRAGRDQHEPAQDHAFHLEGPGGQQVGRPLIAEAPDLERRQRRYARSETHVLFVPSPGRRLLAPLRAAHRALLGRGLQLTPWHGPFSPIAWLALGKPHMLCNIAHLEIVIIRPVQLRCKARPAHCGQGMPSSGGSRSREPHADLPWEKFRIWAVPCKSVLIST